MKNDCHELHDPETGLLILDPKHPGVNDLGYRKRRSDFFSLAQHHRLNALELPYIDYDE